MVRETCDVAVVGAGISGAIIALVLADIGMDVVVVDRRQPVHGSTLASTAMIQFELDVPLLDLSTKLGSRRAERAYRRSADSVADLGRLLRRHGIRCGWRDRSALYLAGNAMGYRRLRQEAAYRARIGLDSTYLDHATLLKDFGIDRTGAVMSRGAAELNPAQAAAGCLRAAQRRGTRVYAPHDIAHVESVSDGVELMAASGGAIRARRVIFATGYEVAPGIPKGEYDIVSSWAIATKPLDRSALWPGRCLIWEAADPYLYLRSTVDNRILAGGEDSGLTDPARRDGAIASKSAALLKKLSTLLPGRSLAVDYAWAGAFADSPTGLPHIAQVESLSRCLSVLGCGGNGITFSMIAAQIAAAWVKGRRDPDADLFE